MPRRANTCGRDVRVGLHIPFWVKAPRQFVLRATQPLFGHLPKKPSLPFRVLMRQFASVRRRWEHEIIRKSVLLDGAWYLKTYPDIAAADIEPSLHFLKHGAQERRDPGPFFDTGYYLAQGPEVAGSKMNPLVHYLLYGYDEGRRIQPSQGAG